MESPEGLKKVAILGFANSWKEAPFDDPTIEVWGLNELHKYIKPGRWSRWFEVHDDETLGVTARDLSEGEQKRHLEWLSQSYGDRPIYMQPQFCDGRFPNAVKLPLETLVQRFGRYFTSSIGYMVGIAILDGYQWIGLYGVDLASDVEYPGQRPNTEYLIGIARGLGIHVEIAKSSALLKAGHLYGFEKPIGEQSNLASILRNRIDALKKEHEKHLATLNTLDGAMQEADNIVKLLAYQERGCVVTTY